MSFYFDSFNLNKVIYISRNKLIKMTGLSKRCKNDNRQHQEVSYSFVLDQDFALIHSVTKYALQFQNKAHFLKSHFRMMQ